jgi:hypothetical protein
LIKISLRAGIYESVADAAKTSDNELRALNHLLRLNIVVNAEKNQRLTVPLMALINVRGFRVIAVSLVPISSHTIVFGSSDAGNSFILKDHAVEMALDTLGRSLNLKEHYFLAKDSDKPKKFRVCADLEVHHGRDGRYYVIDAARLCPPTFPKHGKKLEHLIHVFRPEFLVKYSRELCSDALSGFAKIDGLIHSSEIKDATEYLLDKVIEDVVRHLDSSSELQKLNLSYVLHSFGVNMRYLGYVYSKCPSCKNGARIADMLLTEMCTRSIKCIGRYSLRKCQEQAFSSKARIAACNQVIADLANDIYGSAQDTKRFTNFWNNQLMEEMKSKFFPASLAMPKTGMQVRDRVNVLKIADDVLIRLGFSVSNSEVMKLRESSALPLKSANFEDFDTDITDNAPIHGKIGRRTKVKKNGPTLISKVDAAGIEMKSDYQVKSFSFLPAIKAFELIQQALTESNSKTRCALLQKSLSQLNQTRRKNPSSGENVLTFSVECLLRLSLECRFSFKSNVLLRKCDSVVAELERVFPESEASSGLKLRIKLHRLLWDSASDLNWHKNCLSAINSYSEWNSRFEGNQRSQDLSRQYFASIFLARLSKLILRLSVTAESSNDWKEFIYQNVRLASNFSEMLVFQNESFWEGRDLLEEAKSVVDRLMSNSSPSLTTIVFEPVIFAARILCFLKSQSIEDSGSLSQGISLCRRALQQLIDLGALPTLVGSSYSIQDIEHALLSLCSTHSADDLFPVELRYGNTSKPLKLGSSLWMLNFELNDPTTRITLVDHVVYELHPAMGSDLIHKETQGPSFKYQNSSWGSLPVKIRPALKPPLDKESVMIEHTIDMEETAKFQESIEYFKLSDWPPFIVKD